MASFSASFWTPDYTGGLDVILSKLQQGVVENKQMLTIAKLRADAEQAYAKNLTDILTATNKISGGFEKDDGASVRKAYECIRAEIEAAAKCHRNIATNINELVATPFGQWSHAHSTRVQNSRDDLQTSLKAHEKQMDLTRKLRSTYFNRCRQLEDLEEEDKLAFQDPEKLGAKDVNDIGSPKSQDSTHEVDSNQGSVTLGVESYNDSDLKSLISALLREAQLKELKIPILGTYEDVSSGADITKNIQVYKQIDDLQTAEEIGQDLISHGFIRLVGAVGNTFVNSSRMNYQWRPRAFEVAGLSDASDSRGSTIAHGSDVKDALLGKPMGELLSSTFNSPWTALNSSSAQIPPAVRLRREATEADKTYKTSVRKLDDLRCQLEESIVDHLRFMERCELDRLKALKAIILDLSGAISNAIPSLQSTVDHMMLFHETIVPESDLRYLIENYRTGYFAPSVVNYDNYYNRVEKQIFGIDIEARARADHKRIPSIITAALTLLDQRYPLLEGDQARQGVWLVDVPLAATHHLRRALNTTSEALGDVLNKYETPILASALKLYLLELPDSLVSCQLYEIIRTTYSSPESLPSSTKRISILQNALGQLRLANIATLDALTTHFARLIELTSADEVFISTLANGLAPCILRAKSERASMMQDKNAYRLVKDLLEHRQLIFGELKRVASASSRLTHNNSDGANRPRAVSTDESQRRSNVEARNRAIASRSRNHSPVPHHVRGHHRDRSSDPQGTRFPVHSSPSRSEARRDSGRASLGIPDDEKHTNDHLLSP